MISNYKPIVTLLFNFLAIGILWGCSNYSVNSTNNSGNNNSSKKDTTYFGMNIEPIFSGSCGGSSCHIPGPQSGVTLSDYGSVINSIGAQYGVKIIKAGDAANSPIIDKISNASPKFGVRMPKGRNPLDKAQIDTLKAWINRGAKEHS